MRVLVLFREKPEVLVTRWLVLGSSPASGLKVSKSRDRVPISRPLLPTTSGHSGCVFLAFCPSGRSVSPRGVRDSRRASDPLVLLCWEEPCSSKLNLFSFSIIFFPKVPYFKQCFGPRKSKLKTKPKEQKEYVPMETREVTGYSGR